jgi:hypothetical protein
MSLTSMVETHIDRPIAAGTITDPMMMGQSTQIQGDRTSRSLGVIHSLITERVRKARLESDRVNAEESLRLIVHIGARMARPLMMTTQSTIGADTVGLKRTGLRMVARMDREEITQVKAERMMGRPQEIAATTINGAIAATRQGFRMIAGRRKMKVTRSSTKLLRGSLGRGSP